MHEVDQEYLREAGERLEAAFVLSAFAAELSGKANG